MPEITFREALRQALREEMRRDDRVFLMGEDIGAYGGSYAVTKGLLEEFGDDRVKDTPIAESVIVGAGIGAAMAGLRPIVEMMTINFSLLAIDQIVNNASKMLLHVRRPDQRAARHPHGERRRHASSARSTPTASKAGTRTSRALKVVRAVEPLRREGPAARRACTTTTRSSSSSTRRSIRQRGEVPESRTASRSARRRSPARART